MFCPPIPSSAAPTPNGIAADTAPVSAQIATGQTRPLPALQCPAIQSHDGVSMAITKALEALSLVAVESRLCHGRTGMMNPQPDLLKTQQIVGEALEWLRQHHALSDYLNGPEMKSTERVYAAAAIHTKFLLAHPEVHNAVPVASALYTSLILASIEMTHPGLKHHFQPLRFVQPQPDGRPDAIYDVVLYNALPHLDAQGYATLADATDRDIDILTIRLQTLADLAALLHACKSSVVIINPACTEKIISFELNHAVSDTWDALGRMMDQARFDKYGPLHTFIAWTGRYDPHTATPTQAPF